MKPYRILSNLVGFMLFVQVILGGIATLIDTNYRFVHVIWGVLSLAVLIVATIFGFRELGSKSTLFRVGIVAIVDFLVQGGIGIGAILNNYDPTTVVVHLTNAFVLTVLVTYLISFADSADKAAALTTSAVKPM